MIAIYTSWKGKDAYRRHIHIGGCISFMIGHCYDLLPAMMPACLPTPPCLSGTSRVRRGRMCGSSGSPRPSPMHRTWRTGSASDLQVCVEGGRGGYCEVKGNLRDRSVIYKCDTKPKRPPRQKCHEPASGDAPYQEASDDVWIFFHPTHLTRSPASLPLGLFNFKPSVRPVPLEAHIQGFPGMNKCGYMLEIFRSRMNKCRYPGAAMIEYILGERYPWWIPPSPYHTSGKFYCPRMATMNKPTYAAIQVRN